MYHMPFGAGSYSGDEEKETNWIGAGAGGLLSLIGLGGAASSVGSYDPVLRAINDPGSEYWKNISSYFSKVAASGAPTIDTITSFLRSQGLDSSSATNLGLQHAKEQTLKNQELVTRELEKARLDSQDTLLRASAAGRDEQGSFFDQVLGLGGGLLAHFL